MLRARHFQKSAPASRRMAHRAVAIAALFCSVWAVRAEEHVVAARGGHAGDQGADHVEVAGYVPLRCDTRALSCRRMEMAGASTRRLLADGDESAEGVVVTRNEAEERAIVLRMEEEHAKRQQREDARAQPQVPAWYTHPGARDRSIRAGQRLPGHESDPAPQERACAVATPLPLPAPWHRLLASAQWRGGGKPARVKLGALACPARCVGPPTKARLLLPRPYHRPQGACSACQGGAKGQEGGTER